MRWSLKRELGCAPRHPFVFPEHHESHAASAFFASPYESAAIVTMDGVGEWTTTSICHGKGNKLSMLREIRFPHSLGLLYSAFTYHCGFKVNSGEYKLMGLAPYGEPKYAELIRRHLIDLRDDGSYKLDLAYFDFATGLRMTNAKFDRLFGAARRTPEMALEQFHMDMAASVQAITEEVILKTTRHAQEITGESNLCLAGGVALNCVGNGKILRDARFDSIWIQPAAGDAGGALGAALFVWHHLLEKPRTGRSNDGQKGSLLGPKFSNDEVRASLEERQLVSESYDDEDRLVTRVAELIDAGNVVGWFQGAMEFGPRALGARSILGDARSPQMQSVMNLKIKFRESFRPFAPIVLREDASEYFEIASKHESPYMLVVAPVREEKRKPIDPGKTGLDQLHQLRSIVPAITHVDFSARLQTVDDQRNPRLAKLLRAFKRRTGCPVLINTSFNVRGEPIVCSPRDAVQCFIGTEMDVLVLENHIVVRSAQKLMPTVDRERYLNSFELD